MHSFDVTAVLRPVNELRKNILPTYFSHYDVISPTKQFCNIKSISCIYRLEPHEFTCIKWRKARDHTGSLQWRVTLPHPVVESGLLRPYFHISVGQSLVMM